MLSYRKLAMRVLGRPLNTGGGYKSNPSPVPAGRRTDSYRRPAYRGGLPPAFAGTYYIENGDIVISAGTETGTNKVEQGGTLKKRERQGHHHHKS